MNRFNSSLAWAVLLAVVSIPIFVHLNHQPIRIWDEARLAMNAYEMNRDGNLLVTHFEGKPDLWNTKPPLMIWLQVLCIKILGFTELAVRLPSAIAALFTCLVMALFSKRYFNDALPVLFQRAKIPSAQFIFPHRLQITGIVLLPQKIISPGKQ